jgi:hypothetical protein
LWALGLKRSPVKKFQYLKTIKNRRVWTMPMIHKMEPCLYNRLNRLSQMKIRRQTAPAFPPACVKEKKMKKPAPNVRQIQGCKAGRARRNKIAAGSRNRIKYANVLKIMRPELPAHGADDPWKQRFLK